MQDSSWGAGGRGGGGMVEREDFYTIKPMIKKEKSEMK